VTVKRQRDDHPVGLQDRPDLERHVEHDQDLDVQTIADCVSIGPRQAVKYVWRMSACVRGASIQIEVQGQDYAPRTLQFGRAHELFMA
jgi:hypothetical protein